MRAISAADGKCAAGKIHRHLAAFGADEGSAVDPAEGFDDVSVVLACGELHAVSGTGVYGGEYARAIVAGL